MKRSINSENLIVVAAIAIAISLLASACGPSNMRTLKAKTGVKVFSDKAADKDGTSKSSDKDVKTQEEKIITAIQEKRIADGETVVDVSAAKDLANRLKYVKYQFVSGFDEIAVALTINNKLYAATFKEGKVSEDGLTVEFVKTTEAHEVINGEKSEAQVKLNLSAKIQKQDQNLLIVSLYEKTTDAKKAVKTAEVSVLVKLSKAVATVTSKDANILKMKDAAITTRISQVYISDNSVLDAKLIDQIQKLESNANTIVISVNDAKTSNLQYSLVSILNLASNTTDAVVNGTSDDLKSMKTAYKKIELISGSAILDAKEVSLKFEDKKSSELSTALLTLSSTEDKSEDDEEGSAEGQAGGQEGNTPGFTDQPIDQAADFSDVTTGTTSVPGAKKEDFSDVNLGAPKAKKADFSDVTTGAPKAKKADFSDVITGATLKTNPDWLKVAPKEKPFKVDFKAYGMKEPNYIQVPLKPKTTAAPKSNTHLENKAVNGLGVKSPSHIQRISK